MTSFWSHIMYIVKLIPCYLETLIITPSHVAKNLINTAFSFGKQGSQTYVMI